VTGEGNSPHTTVWICSFRPCHCMFDLGLHALHAVIFVGSETLHGSSVQFQVCITGSCQYYVMGS